MERGYCEESMREIQSERTLARIAESSNSRSKIYTFGVIIDVSEPFRLGDSTNYTSKLKIIDPSFNFNSEIENEEIRFQNFVHIYIYSPVPEKLPKVVYIGDIIRLRRFNFMVNDKGELVGHMQNYSNWMTFDVTERNGFTIQSCMQREKNESRTLSTMETDRVRALRRWALSFFGANSIRSVTWWKKFKDPASDELAANEKITLPDVDLILKTTKVMPDKKSIDFCDEEGRKYSLFLQAVPMLWENQVIKLRSVSLHFSQEGRLILLNNTSSCLLLPEEYFDYKLFNEQFFVSNKDKIRYRSPQIRRRGAAESFETRKSVTDCYPFLDDFYFEDFFIRKKEIIRQSFPKKIVSSEASIVKKEYFNRLPALLANFLSVTRSNIEDIRFQKFVIQVNVIDIEHRSFEDSAYTFCESCHTSRRLVDSHDFNCCGRILNICVTVKLLVADESLADGEVFPIFVVTRSVQNNPFLLWKVLPGMEDYKAWAAMTSADFTDFLTKLNALSRFPEKMKVVVEAKETRTHKLFFEVTDTFFLP